MVRRQPAGRDGAVDVRMSQKVLAPGVEDAEEADLGRPARQYYPGSGARLCRPAYLESILHELRKHVEGELEDAQR